MLRSLVSQLIDLSGETFPLIDRLFKSSCGDRARQPSRRELLELLQLGLTAKTNDNDKVYILLDALDECDSAEGDHLEAAMAQMHDWNLQGAHFLITSRRDGLANSALGNIVSLQDRVPIRQQEVDGDIRAWVTDQLSPRARLGRKLSKWDQQDSLKTRIQSELLEKASGMYDTLITRMFQHLTNDTSGFS